MPAPMTANRRSRWSPICFPHEVPPAGPGDRPASPARTVFPVQGGDAPKTRPGSSPPCPRDVTGRSHAGNAGDTSPCDGDRSRGATLVARRRRNVGSGMKRTESPRMSYQAEYIWIDGTEPSPLLRSKTRIVAEGKEPGIWGFDGSSTNQATGNDSDCVLRPVFTLPRPAAGPGRPARHVRGAPDRLLAAPDQHPGRLRGRRRAVRRPGAVVRHRAGVHLPPRRPAAGVAGARATPRPRARTTAASAATRCPGRDIVERHTVGLHGRRAGHRGHQRRGDDGPVGVPDRRPAAAG